MTINDLQVFRNLVEGKFNATELAAIHEVLRDYEPPKQSFAAKAKEVASDLLILTISVGAVACAYYYK